MAIAFKKKSNEECGKENYSRKNKKSEGGKIVVISKQ